MPPVVSADRRGRPIVSYVRVGNLTPAPRARSTPSPECSPANSARRRSGSIFINPGVVETEGTRSSGIIGSDFEKAAIAQTPLGRIGQPGEIASIAVFLASEDSAWLTGEQLLATGGLG